MPRSITFTVSEDYTGDLKKRLQKLGISQGALARELGLQESQISRWFNKPVQPRVANIMKIEAAVAAIRKRMEKERRKAK
jgi:predicted transcriptional regulator